MGVLRRIAACTERIVANSQRALELQEEMVASFQEDRAAQKELTDKNLRTLDEWKTVCDSYREELARMMAARIVASAPDPGSSSGIGGTASDPASGGGGTGAVSRPVVSAPDPGPGS
jgi:hypothetical protein